jgi:hypothetical protein
MLIGMAVVYYRSSPERPVMVADLIMRQRFCFAAVGVGRGRIAAGDSSGDDEIVVGGVPGLVFVVEGVGS